MASSIGGSREGRTRRVVSVEIGATAVWAAETEVRGGEARLLRMGSSPLPPGCWDDPARHREELATAIRSAMTGAGIHAKEVVTALPRRFVTIKYAKLPPGSPEHIAGMVRFEAQQYVPFPIDEVVLDHQTVSESGDEMATVMIVAARKSLVQEILAAFDRAGLDVSRVTVSSLALAEHLHNVPVSTAICRLDEAHVDLAVASAGRVLFSRAVELLEPPVTTEGVEMLASEIGRSLAAYQTEYRTQPVERVLLVSDGDGGDGLAQTLSSILQIEVEPLPTDGVAGRSKGAAPMALGMALHEAADPLAQVNLLPPERVAKKLEARRKKVSRVAAALVVLVLALGGWFAMRAVEAQRQEARKAAYQNARLRRIEPIVKKAQEEAEQLRRVYLTVNYGLGRDRPVVDVVKAISDALPRKEGIYLTQLAFDRNGPVVLHGNAGSQEAVTEFLTALQGTGIFAEARLGYLGDAGATPGALASAPLAEGGKQPAMSFMLYCRLPQPPSLDEKKPAARAARPGAGTLQGGIP